MLAKIRDYLSGVYLNTLFTIINAFLIARLLGPKDYGLWGLMSLVLLYGGYLHLGLGNAMVKDVSFYAGRHDGPRISSIKATVFYCVLAASLTAALILSAVFTFYFLGRDNAFLFCLYLLCVNLALKLVADYFIFFFVSESNFSAVRNIKIFKEAVTFLFVIALVRGLRINGVVLAFLLGSLASILYIFSSYRPKIGRGIDLRLVLPLVRSGLPLMSAGFAFSFFITLERPLIFRYFGSQPLGYYNIASQMAFLLILFPLGCKMTMLPELMRKAGAVKTSPEQAVKMVYGPSLAVSYLMSAVLGAAYIFLPLLLKVFIPRYLASLDVSRMLLLGVAFIATSLLMEAVFIMLDFHYRWLCVIIAGLSIKAAAVYILVLRGAQLTQIAAVTNAAYFIYSVSVITYVFTRSREARRLIAGYFTRVYIPFAYCGSVLLLLNGLERSACVLPQEPCFSVGVQFAVYAAFLVIPAIFTAKKLYSRRGGLFSIDPECGFF